MPKDPKKDASNGQIPPRSLEHLNDRDLAKVLLRPDRARKRAERPWWFRLLDWLKQTPSD